MGCLAILSLSALLVCGGYREQATERAKLSFRDLSAQSALLQFNGEFAESFATLQQALNLSQDNGLKGSEGKCLIRMGILQWDLGDIDESRRFFAEAAATFKKIGDLRSHEYSAKCLEMIRLYDLGKEDRKERLFYRSVDCFEGASLLGRELGFPELQLKCLRQQALSYLDMRRLELFFENSRRGLAISTEMHHRLEQGRCLNNIGVYYQQRTDYSRSVTYLEKALATIRETGDEAAEAECLNNLGMVYRELGNLVLSHFFLSKALERDTKLGDPNSISMDLDNIGSVLLRKGMDENNEQDLRQALVAFQTGLAIKTRGNGEALISFAALNNVGIVLNELRDYGGARRHFERALAVADSDRSALERSHAVCNIAASYLAEQNVQKAIVYYNLSYQASLKQAFENVFIESCYGLGQCYERLHDIDSALSFYRQAIEAIENVKARITSESFMIGFARNKFGAYQRAIPLLADQYFRQPRPGGLDELFDLFERARARAFLESVREARADVTDADISELAERRQSIAGNISQLSLKLANHALSSEEEQATRDELALEEEEDIRLASEMRGAPQPREEGWRKEIRPLRDIQLLLTAEEAVLLEYFLGEQRSYLIFVSPASAELYALPAKGKIEQSLRAYLKLVASRSMAPQFGFEAAERIGRELIPFGDDERLKSAKALIVIPDGVLHELPFEAIRVPHAAGSSYLIEDLAISYCPSASVLAALRGLIRPGKWEKDLLGVGGPDYERYGVREDGGRGGSSTAYHTEGIDLSPLPFSKMEVRDIAGLFGKAASDILTGEAANESQIKRLSLKSYRIVHFACHAFFDEPHPLRSALALSATDEMENDGFLQTREIYGLTMTADLVVLSACQSGKGLLEGSEGPMGLARAFFFAGARSVISSLWPINDKATVTFMHEFYRSLVGGLSAGEALRSAKKKMLRSPWAHPYYWASFLLQGDSSAAGETNKTQDRGLTKELKAGQGRFYRSRIVRKSGDHPKIRFSLKKFRADIGRDEDLTVLDLVTGPDRQQSSIKELENIEFRPRPFPPSENEGP